MTDARAATIAATFARPQHYQWCGAPPLVPPMHEMVAAFCDFLENRMATKNIPLLRRMVADFYAGHDQTLQEFVELSVNLVAVLPLETREPSKRAIAARILQQQQRRMHMSSASLAATGGAGHSESPCVFMYFQTRVGTKNLPWLKRIYCEFCEGREDALIDFLRIGAEVISILPVHLPVDDSQRWMMYTPPQMLLPFTDARTSINCDVNAGGDGGIMSDHRPATPRTPMKRAVQQDPDDSAAAASPPPTKSLKRSPHAKPSGEHVHVVDEGQLELIRAEYMRIEATEPWTRVFHEDLKSPFELKTSPKLGFALKRFLVEHGRAIWERTFWIPLSMSKDRQMLIERAKRQDSAKKIFMRRVIKPVHKFLGAQFFVDLDESKTHHEGWWYRQPVVDLGTLWRTKGARFCFEYLRGQCLERFPDTQCPELRAKTRGHHVWSESMWSSDSAVNYVLVDIRRLKGTTDEDLGHGSDGCGADDDGEDGDDDDDDDDDESE